MTSDDAQLLRSVRARIAQVPGITEVERRGEIALFHGGTELGRIVLRSPPRLVVGEVQQEITGLPQAAAAEKKIRALAEARAARLPQLDLFAKK